MSNKPVETPIARSGLVETFETYKGGMTLAFAALLYVGSWAAVALTPWRTAAQIGVSIGEAALIGGLCDYIALKMIFERHWYLPGSGVLPRNRQKLIDGIASTIENEWLTPEMIGKKLAEMELVGRLGTYLQEVNIHDLLGPGGLERMLSRASDYLESPDARERLETILRKTMPKTVRGLDWVLEKIRVRTMASRILANLRQALSQVQNDPEVMLTLENAVHEFGQQLHDPSSYARERAQRLIDRMVERAVAASRGQIAGMVREKLAQLTDEQIRFQIESKTRTHLDWIRVNGVTFGAFFGLVFAILRMAVQYQTPLLAKVAG
ncbi:MAG TPA: DUF445 family protein [Candidatus Binataceae bacterium]|nr:DUF445 family protein [Candidatus Binataceae bacterium]